MAQSNLNIRIDSDVKKQAEEIFADMGMTTTTAINVFMKQVIKTGSIPFQITTRPVDPFYSEANQRHLRKAQEQLERGDVVVKTMDELEAMAADE